MLQSQPRSLLAAGALAALLLTDVACSERTNVAKNHGTGGTGGDAGAADQPSVAGSTGAVGGNAASGSATGGNAAGGTETNTGPGGAAGGSDEAAGAAGAAGVGGEGSLPTDALVVAGLTFGAQPQSASSPAGVYGTAFVNGSWAKVKWLGGGHAPELGGVSVALLNDGTGVAALPTASTLYSATWNGQWSTTSAVPDTSTAWLGRMVPTSEGAMVAYAAPGETVDVGTYASATGSWTIATNTGAQGARCYPEVARVGSDDVLVAYYDYRSHAYKWVRRTGTAWSEPAPIPVTFEQDSDHSLDHTQLELVRRAQSDEVLGIFWSNYGTFRYTVFSNGAWSPSQPLLSDLADDLGHRPNYITALPDGRIAFVYVGYGGGAPGTKVAFFDGTWSEFKVVPGVQAFAFDQVAISRGVSGAVLELVYSQAQLGGDPPPNAYMLKHVRLTDEASWAWTEPVTIDADHVWATVSMAASP